MPGVCLRGSLSCLKGFNWVRLWGDTGRQGESSLGWEGDQSTSQDPIASRDSQKPPRSGLGCSWPT